MDNYFHSVTLDRDKCKGCTNCIKRCPTEAIRVRDGKAKIIDERCIDCGECIRVCPYHAKIAKTDPLASINRFKYKIALPAPALYGQFKNLTSINKVLFGLRMMGFDDVFEVAKGADVVSSFIKKTIQTKKNLAPVISSACPAIVRLIQVRFPDLIDNIVPVLSPMEVAAQMAKKEFCSKRHVDESEVGTFFITPCAAKMTSIRNPIGIKKSSVDGAISIVEIYGLLSSQIEKPDSAIILQKASAYGVGWANSGGESFAVGCENYLAVDGIANVIRVLEEIENDKLNDLEFFEGLACSGGCVGGPLVFENGFVAKNRVRKLVEGLQKEKPFEFDEKIKDNEYIMEYTEKISSKPVMKLDANITEAIRKMDLMDSINKDLPGLDCGSCGSPSCSTLAEDIVRGQALEMDCVFKLREKVKHLAQEMIDLSNNIPTVKKKE